MHDIRLGSLAVNRDLRKASSISQRSVVVGGKLDSTEVFQIPSSNFSAKAIRKFRITPVGASQGMLWTAGDNGI
jgi:hypothetical protein